MRKEKLKTVKVFKKDAAEFLFRETYDLKVIRLASEAISVPVPPIFTPISKAL